VRLAVDTPHQVRVLRDYKISFGNRLVKGAFSVDFEYEFGKIRTCVPLPTSGTKPALNRLLFKTSSRAFSVSGRRI